MNAINICENINKNFSSKIEKKVIFIIWNKNGVEGSSVV